MAQELRNRFRRHCQGIDRLLEAALGPSGRVVQAAAALEGPAGLQDARKAVLALQPEDRAHCLDGVTASVASLLRNQSRTTATSKKKSVNAAAEALLEAVSSRADLFSTAQLLQILGAYQAAEALCPRTGRSETRIACGRRQIGGGASSRVSRFSPTPVTPAVGQQRRAAAAAA